MKKLFITTMTALMFSVFTNAQSGLNIGFSIGFPYETYDFNDYSFAFNGDINYLFEVSPAFDLGIATGYGYVFGSSYDYYVGPILGWVTYDSPDYQYVPTAAAFRLKANSRLTFGTDIGYAISVSSEKDPLGFEYSGGFYWRPMVGFNMNERLQLNFNYIGISEEYFYYSAFNLGLTVNIN